MLQRLEQERDKMNTTSDDLRYKINLTLSEIQQLKTDCIYLAEKREHSDYIDYSHSSYTRSKEENLIMTPSQIHGRNQTLGQSSRTAFQTSSRP